MVVAIRERGRMSSEVVVSNEKMGDKENFAYWGRKMGK